MRTCLVVRDEPLEWWWTVVVVVVQVQRCNLPHFGLCHLTDLPTRPESRVPAMVPCLSSRPLLGSRDCDPSRVASLRVYIRAYRAESMYVHTYIH